ncbi:MAG: AAA domain-containing protein [Verrucomicrobiia bacterium]
MSTEPQVAASRVGAGDVERIRFTRELTFADQLAPKLFRDDRPAPHLEPPDADRIRRRLLASHVRLSENMAPEVFECVRRAVAVLSVTKPVEIYQIAGQENAAVWTCPDVVFVSLQGSMMSQLDTESFVAMLGHEFGHHLAHTGCFAGTPRQVLIQCAADIAYDEQLPAEVRVAASRLAMAKEFTADRFAALATGSLDAPLRLMMSVVTGLPSERLKTDGETYLAQARALFETAGEKESSIVGSHPEHLLRAYALALFVESNLFRALTGTGAGSRKLEDIDAALERLLVGAGERVFEQQREGSVPPEIHEFALCAASLVANADASMDESEAKALEETFSTLLPNWKELLSLEKAEARFKELLPLAVAGGEGLAVSVFHLLVHVMLADREVHVRELEMLAAIGRSLDREALFDHLLAATARAVRMARSESPVERPLPALPPAKHEAQAALDGLFAGMSRRGGGTVALSRLLRILGKQAWEESLLLVIKKAITPHHLILEAPPAAEEDGTVRSEQMLAFCLTDEELARREAASLAERANELASVKTHSALVAALKHLRERLVSGDGRSPSVRLYRASSGRHFDLAQLDRVIAGRSERITAMLHDNTTIPLLSGEEAGQHKAASDLSRAVRSLDREFKARVEETGTRDLFVGYPFLIGVVSGFFVRAPLMLHPFSLAGDGRGAGSYTLKRREDDEATANQALLRLLFAKKGYAFTEELAASLDAKAAEGCEALLEALRQIGLDARPLTGSVVPFEEMNPAATEMLPEGIAVSENAVVGFFPQSSSDLLQDYDDLLAKLEANPGANLEEALNAASQLLPVNYRPAFQPAAGDGTPDQPIVYADPSQREAVLRSRAARLLVVDGPPGTGKSQTIVNLVADQLSRGGRVAIVCEKRVALDVVKQRMNAAGIGHLAAVVHDVYDDRKPLYTHVADRLENAERRAYNDDSLRAARGEAEVIELKLALRARLLARPSDTVMSLGQLHAMAASISGPAATAPGFETVTHDDLPRLVQNAKELHAFARLWSADSVLRSRIAGQRRVSLANASPADIQAIAADLRRTHDTALAYARFQTVRQFAPDTLETAEPALKLGASFAGGLGAPVLPELPRRMIALRVRETARVAEIEELFAQLEKHRAAAEAEKERVQLETSNELTAALSIAARHVGSFFRFLSPAWRKASRAIGETLIHHWPEKAGAKLDAALLATLERRVQAARAWTAAEALFRDFQLQSQLPRQADALYTQVAEMLAPWKASAQLAGAKAALESVSLWPLAGDGAVEWKAWAAKCQLALDHLAAQRAYFKAAWKAAESFPQVAELQPDGLAKLAEAFSKDANALCSADCIVQQMQKILPEAVALVESLADTLPEAPASAWTDAVLRGWAEAKIAAAETADADLGLLDQAPPLGSLEKASERLLELHKAIAREESLRLAAQWDGVGLMAVNPAEPRARRTPEQTARENLIRECRKQRNVTPMRTLVRRTAQQGLLDVVPVWLMSPETTAILFPRQPVFDLLIVDEASQCTVESGLPVLTRARRAVVAGDDKQMPPSSFFKAASTLEVESADNTTADVATDAFESESLLVLARSGGAGSPLRWHYRALFEELIAFSNHSMYGGSLLTIPATRSRSAAPALRWVRIENGVWDEGSNEPEAKRVVDLLGELLSRPKPPSVGVVTFNLQQRRAILDEIDARRGSDETFARAYDAAASAESLDARPFIKNLESVQGDERDVIIFSLGYAPTKRKKRDGSEETYVPARFGPLGQKGGERRLNVAVSRAKAEIVVVSSFDPSMLSVAHTKHDGPRMFKAFVEFARHLGEGRRNQAEKILSLVNDATQSRHSAVSAHEGNSELYLPLHHQIALALESEGFKVETQVGTSEFRLPVAIVHGGDAHRYALAILCDEGVAEPSVFEDYVHVPNVLAHRQWRHLWVNAREWHRERPRVIERIRASLS